MRGREDEFMLEKIDLTKKMPKEEYRRKMDLLEPKLGELQRRCKELGIPVMIAFEGYPAAGKGMQIGALIHAMDPRGFEVHAVKRETEVEHMHPFMWRFWTKMPAKGRIALYDTSWYRKVLSERFEDKADKKSVAHAFGSILSFEQQITDDGIVLVKLFLAIDQKEQKARFKKLEENDETAWRVSAIDHECNKNFGKFEKIYDEMLRRTDTDYAPWHIIESTDRRFATVKIYTIVINALAESIEKATAQKPAARVQKTYIEDRDLKESILSKTDLSLAYSKKEYKQRLEKLQSKIQLLHGELYQKRIPVVLGFEGWDAGGKGGAIKRLTEKMDPRGYMVVPTASPNDWEKAHHYLWRFWQAMPKAGHVAIFDRTWYGRVMVERIEGFCTTDEWKRAYKEINDMEWDLYDSGAIVMKFWMQIDKDEQERRFRERQVNPEKQWKITDEDWRNREKWDQYEEAVNEMLIRTSTPYAPWIVVEGNDKYYARIKVLDTVVDAIEKRLRD